MKYWWRSSTAILVSLILMIGIPLLLLHHRVPVSTGSVRQKPRTSVLTFEESSKRVKNEMAESMYRFDRGLHLPLMKLAAAHSDRQLRVMGALAWLKSQKLAVGATVRNAVSGLESSLSSLRRLGELFHSVTAVFVENDSTDETRSFLYRLSQRSTGNLRVVLLGCGTVNSAKPCYANITYGSSGRQHSPGFEDQADRSHAEESVDRGLVMAALRNIYLDFIYERVDADLLMVLEADLIWQPWDLATMAQGLFHFKSQPKLDSLCAFATYHAATMVQDPCTLIFYNNKHFYVETEELDSPFVNRFGRNNGIVFRLLEAANGLDPPVPPVKVDACFQGAAFYRMSSLRAAAAYYRYSEGEWHCEHSTLSMQLRENYLDTQMLLRIDYQFSG